MGQTTEEDAPDNIVQDTYSPDQDRSLTDAVLDAIEECKGEDLLRRDFVLYEDINPDSLDTLFRHDAQPRTRVAFSTDGVRIELWGDGGVESAWKSEQLRSNCGVGVSRMDSLGLSERGSFAMVSEAADERRERGSGLAGI